VSQKLPLQAIQIGERRRKDMGNLDLLWGMIGLHLLGVAATSILGRENLVGAMITGRKRLAAPPMDSDASREP
jgi:cytochrome b